MGRGPGYGLPAFVTWRFGSGVTVTLILFICPDITHVCVCVWSAVITVYATCRIPEAWGGGMRAFVHLWAAFQNSFISIISPPALRVSWHICHDYTPRFLALVSSKTPGFFLLCVEGEAWGSVGSASSIWISQRYFSKCAGKTYAESYFPRVGNIAKSTLFHSFLCSIRFRIRVCFSSFEDLWGQERQSLIRLTFLKSENTPLHPPTHPRCSLVWVMWAVSLKSWQPGSCHDWVFSPIFIHRLSLTGLAVNTILHINGKKRNIHIYVEYQNLSMKLSSLFCINVVGIGCIFGKFLLNVACSVWGPGTSKEVFDGNSRSWWNISNNLRLSSGQS